ncbi:MAG: TRAP transporter TatT component family protein [Ignavibacteriales bacterium]|nr:TRAP transporter TatT component family protein [Ignavibacteriales bacterium]
MKRIFLFIATAFLFEGCIQTIALYSMGGILDNGFASFNEESDLQLAHESLGSNLKLIEAMIKSDPENERFLLFAAQGYNSYALAFCEDDSVERARVFYLRAKEYGMRILVKNKRFKEAMDGDITAFREAVKTFDKDDVPAIFWTAFSWGSYVNITRTDVAGLADLSKVQALIEFVAEKNPSFYHGGAYLFLGVIEGTTPRSLGGNPDKAKEYFKKALTINGGKFLMTQLYYARTYAVSTQDQPLFESLLKQVEDASIDDVPEIRLANVVAKQKARKLLAQESELF